MESKRSTYPSTHMESHMGQWLQIDRSILKPPRNLWLAPVAIGDLQDKISSGQSAFQVVSHSSAGDMVNHVVKVTKAKKHVVNPRISTTPKLIKFLSRCYKASPLMLGWWLGTYHDIMILMATNRSKIRWIRSWFRPSLWGRNGTFPQKKNGQNGDWYSWMMTKINLVAGWATPLKNISQLGWLFPMYGKIQNVPNHQPEIVLQCFTMTGFFATHQKTSLRAAYIFYDDVHFFSCQRKIRIYCTIL